MNVFDFGSLSITEQKKILVPKSRAKLFFESDVSDQGAFAYGDVVKFILRIPRKMGTSWVRMILSGDAHKNPNDDSSEEVLYREIPMTWTSFKFDVDCDIYETEINMADIVGEKKCGLFYYAYKAHTAGGITELRDGYNMFQLLVYEKDYRTPDWTKGAVMYHIFVDRFCRAGKCRVKNGAVINDNWENGIPQYGEYPGAEVANNVFFGGNLEGNIKQLDYIASLGVNIIYLSPIFDAYSNHKYVTGDYMHVDEMFGGDEAFSKLISVAGERGIKIILDGVFNHTGADSVYFNKFGNYDSLGAYQSQKSRYYDWYNFREYPDDYECWWGVKVLPRVKCDNEKYRRFILGKNGVIEKWMKMGIYGWRLDVADELSDSFLKQLRKKVKSENKDAIIYGEVWEDASNKISYDCRREYLYGSELDSVMNYPLRDGLIAYLKYGDSFKLVNAVNQIYGHYPKQSADMLMNIMGTHDTERIITALSADEAGD